LDDLRVIVADLKKEFGNDSVFILGENEKLCNVETRSSGSLALDIALGGGYGKGRAVELRGAERAGKSSLLCMAIAEAQKNEEDKLCAIIDTEHTFNPDWAMKLGVNLNSLVFSQPDKPAEEIYEMIEVMLKTKKFSIIGLDSLAGLVPKEEFESDEWDKESRVGGTSKINARAIRKLINTGLLSDSGTTLIIINQLRDAIGVFSQYGVPTTTVGGRSWKHAFTHQIDVSTGEFFSVGNGADKKFLGQQIVTKVVKNKIGPPFRRAVIDIYYEYGVDRVAELVSVARLMGVLHAAGAWLTAMDPRTGEVLLHNGKEIKFNGKEKAREALNEDIEKTGGEIYLKILNLVLDIVRVGEM
jgi:recombination protein RecA